MPDQVLLTGISGFLGGHIALRLLAAGYHVRGSVRSPEKAATIRATLERHGVDSGRLEFVTLDLLSPEGWDEAAAGCRFVQHVASPFMIEAPKDPDDLIRPAVEGTSRAIEAALAAGVERIVVTSSVAAVVYGHEGHAGAFTEADWTDLSGPRVGAYAASKTRAEREAWAIVDRAGARQRLVCINPGVILGPLLDADPGTSGLLVLKLLEGAMPLAPKMGFAVADVRDVAEIQVAAMTEAEAGGRRFLVTAGDMNLLELAAALRPHFPWLARKLPRHEAPDFLVRLVAILDARVRDHTAELGRDRRVDGSAALRLLGHPPISPASAAIATAESLVAHGLLPAAPRSAAAEKKD